MMCKPTVTCCLGCYAIFWTTQYNTPRSFRLATTQTFFTTASSLTLPLTVQTAPEPLIAKISDRWRYPFSYRLTGWYCSEAGTTRYSPLTCVPLRAHRQAFLPLRQLHRYLHWFGPMKGTSQC
jgi:hypothetical protein